MAFSVLTVREQKNKTLTVTLKIVQWNLKQKAFHLYPLGNSVLDIKFRIKNSCLGHLKSL